MIVMIMIIIVALHRLDIRRTVRGKIREKQERNKRETREKQERNKRETREKQERNKRETREKQERNKRVRGSNEIQLL